MFALILLLGCPRPPSGVAEGTLARAGETSGAPPIAAPPPPPLPARPGSENTCPAAPLRAWSTLSGPRRVEGVVSFPVPDPNGGLYEVVPAEPIGTEEWVEISTAKLDHARAAPDGTPSLLAVLRSDLELAPITRVVLDGAAAPGSDTPRVELAAGARIRVIEARDGRFHVATLGSRVAVDGWVDGSSLGVSWRPCPYSVAPPNRSLAAGPVLVREGPGGRVLAEVSAITSVMAVASDAPAGWVRVLVTTPTLWIDGYVPAGAVAGR